MKYNVWNVAVKVEPRATFILYITFMRGLPYIAHILFTQVRKFKYERT